MTDPRDPEAPAPRRTATGAVIVGPTVGARFRPGVLYGLPVLALLLSPLAGAGLQQWRTTRLRAGHDGLLEQLLAPAWSQLLLGALALWALLAVWALVPLLLTGKTVLLDEERGTLALRRGPRVVDRAAVAEVEFAVGEAERGGMALIGLRPAADERRPADAGRARAGADPELRQWVVPEIGWDGPSFDGLRVLQRAAGLRPAPDRAEQVAEARRAHREQNHRELAARLGMDWRPEYAHDEAAFQAEFDRVRRVLGGKEPPRAGDPGPRAD